jgi:hypothetical protein
LKLQKLLGPSTGKGVNEIEKTLYKVHQSMLPVFQCLRFFSPKSWKEIRARQSFMWLS